MRMSSPSLLVTTLTLSLSLLACGDKGGGDDTGAGSPDADGDGFTADEDCDDADLAVNPDAVEICDGIDNNCDGLVDDDDPAVDVPANSLWYEDGDGDGYGVDDRAVQACDPPEGHVEAAGDCDDADAAVNPGATEVCDEADVDEDCSGTADDADGGVDPSTGTLYYPDTDVDGFGDATVAGASYCDDPTNEFAVWSTDNTDCDDRDTAVNPAATEVCDDADVDEDCSGAADDADPGVDTSTRSVFYADVDGDGYGDVGDVGTFACDLPAGMVSDHTDCDDGEATVNPGATEVCDDADVDEDCSGAADDADAGVDTATLTLFYPDTDADGYGDDADAGVLACDAPSGTVADHTDCDDVDAAIHPGATEVCDGADNDCDSATSEVGTATFVDTAGAVTDYTATLTGTASSPAVVSLGTDGALAVCEGTWYVNLDVAADVDIWNPSGSPSDVVLDGAATASVITVAADGISLSLEGVSLENGLGSGEAVDEFPGQNGGGIDCTAVGAVVSAMSVDILDNSAGSAVGGGIASSGCELELEDMVISDNSAGFAGGVYVDAGSLVLVDSVVSDNTASVVGGGFMIYDYTGAVTADLDEVEVRDNTSTEIAGGAAILEDGYGVSVTCAGSASSSAGFTGNTAGIGGGIYLAGEADFDVDTCDFGTSAGGDDNSPDDVYTELNEVTYSFDDDATFTCIDGSCGTEVDYLFGAGSSTGSDTTYVAGNVVLADDDLQIASFGLMLSTSEPSCLVDLYLLSNSSTAASGWTVEFAATGLSATTTAAYFDSGAVGVTTTAGTYYALVAGSTCTTTGLTYSYTTGLGTTDAGFGELVGYVYDNSYTSTLAVADTHDFDFFNSGFSFDTSVTLIEY